LQPMRALGITALLTLVVWMGATPAHAQWKWRDKNGQVTASDLPPPRDVPEKDILQRPTVARPVARPAAAAPASAASAAAPVAQSAAPKGGGLEAEVEKRRKAAEAESQAKGKAEEERAASQRRENCGRARNHLATMESGQRVARMNDRGEREILDDRQRSEEIRRARAVIETDCR
jgi:hypothetical protein